VSILLLQNTAATVTLFLETAAGVAATGLTFADVVVDIRKAGGSFTNKVLSGTNFTEIDGGFYELDLVVADVDTLGSLDIRVSGGTIRSALRTATVVTTTAVAETPPETVQTTALFGFIVDGSGNPVQGASISYKILTQPTIVRPGVEGVGVATATEGTTTDANGYFQFTAVTGVSVDVFIPSINYRKTLLVPAASRNIFDIV
jgi:hypothetical protein